MLFVLQPLPFVSCAIEPSVESCPVHKTILPLSFINISIGIDHPSSTVPFLVLKVSIVPIATRVYFDTATLNNVHVFVLNPLSLVFVTVDLDKTLFGSLNAIFLVIVSPVKGWKCFHNILHNLMFDVLFVVNFEIRIFSDKWINLI